jgi:hypothetical protein
VLRRGEGFLAGAFAGAFAAGFTGAFFGGGPGLYSSITLLIVAIGRPGLLKLSLPSGRITESFSPSTDTWSTTSAGNSIVMNSSPDGATAFMPPGPAPPLMRSNRSFSVRNSLWTTARSINVLSIVNTPTVAVYLR